MNDPSQTMDRSALTGAYALDAVDDIERAQVERLLDESPEAAAEVASFQETAARLGAAAATPPPPSLRDAVLVEIRSTRQVPPLTGASNASARNTLRGSRTTVRWLSVAAACLLAVSVGLGAWVVDVRQEAEQSRTVAEALSTVLQHPDRQVLEADFAGGKATLVVAENRVVLVGNGVQAPPAEHDYQLWLLDEEGVPRPSVTLTATGDGGFFADTTGYQPGEKMAVTIEPEGGSRTPTTDPVFVAG